VLVAHVESPHQAHERDFQHDEPQSAREQESAQLGTRAASPGEVRTDAGKEHEYRRAEVRDPARQEQRPAGLRQVEGIEAHVREEIAYMIQRHQHHHQPAQDVDGRDACERMCSNGCVRVRDSDGAFEPGGHAGLSSLESPDGRRAMASG
jgi:hypothetical protein